MSATTQPREHVSGPMEIWVASRVAQRIFNLGITRSYVSDRLQVSRQQFHRYTSGATALTVQRLYDIATILRCPPGWFFEGNPDLPIIDLSSLEDPRLRLMSPGGFDLIEGFNKLTHAQQAMVQALVRELAPPETSEGEPA